MRQERGWVADTCDTMHIPDEGQTHEGARRVARRKRVVRIHAHRRKHIG
jgi:hypothetical protein